MVKRILTGISVVFVVLGFANIVMSIAGVEVAFRLAEVLYPLMILSFFYLLFAYGFPKGM